MKNTDNRGPKTIKFMKNRKGYGSGSIKRAQSSYRIKKN
jgi:hypothetical protein